MLIQSSRCLQLFQQSRAGQGRAASRHCGVHFTWARQLMIKEYYFFAPSRFLLSTLFLDRLSEGSVKWTTWEYRVTGCLAYITWGRKKKRGKKTRWFCIALCCKSFIHIANVCAGEKVPKWGKKKFSRRPSRHLVTGKDEQLYLMIHRASRRQKQNWSIKRWKSIPSRQDNHGACAHLQSALGACLWAAACPASPCVCVALRASSGCWHSRHQLTASTRLHSVPFPSLGARWRGEAVAIYLLSCHGSAVLSWWTRRG